MAGLAYPHPVVSLAVAMILFEGGLSLSVKEFRAIGGVVAWLVTLGAAITWLVGGLAAHWILGLNWPLAILLGAVLVVTGPTVIGPMLRFIRPTGQTGAILKWESIVIDPIGAMLAVLVFQVLIHSGEGTGMVVATIVLKTVAIGVALGVAGALVLGFCMKRDYIPDYLHNPVSVMFVVGVFTGSNLLQTESGLLSVTIMGFALANQKAVSVQHIVEFKENLRVLLIAAVFILLAAHLKPADLEQIGWASVAYLLVLVLVARPASVFMSTLGSKLSIREKLFLSWMAPRGIDLCPAPGRGGAGRFQRAGAANLLCHYRDGGAVWTDCALGGTAPGPGQGASARRAVHGRTVLGARHGQDLV